MMKKMLQMIGIGLLLMGLAASSAMAQGNTQKGTNNQTMASGDIKTLQMVYAGMRSSVMIQIIAKNYLYAGNDIEVTKSKRGIKKALKVFDQTQQQISGALTDAKSKNMMTFITMNVDELKDLLKKPYSLDNAQEVIDLANAIAEGERKLVGVFRKKLSRTYPAGKGQWYNIIQIAKYYMAYEAGIKDTNTVREMKKAVKKMDQFMKDYKAYPNNTVEMSQIVNRMDKLWKVVKQFYADIEEGGLPIIVYQTTDKIGKEIREYAQILVHMKK